MEVKIEAVMRGYPEIEPTIISLVLTDGVVEKGVYALLTASVSILRKWADPLIDVSESMDDAMDAIMDGLAGNTPLLPYVIVIGDDIAEVRGHAVRSWTSSGRFFFCASCGMPIKSQQGCGCGKTYTPNLFGLAPQEINWVSMIIPPEILCLRGHFLWRGEGRMLDEDRIRRSIDVGRELEDFLRVTIGD